MHTFKKEERLCNKRLIDKLFHNGSSFLCYPFKVSWSAADGVQIMPVQVLFAVSKKRYKRAVDRNLLKRRMREAYRLHKQEALYNFLQQADKRIILSIAYIGKEISDYKLIDKKMQKLFTQLSEDIAK
jgi:ribonuclease P protein component